MTNSMDMNLSKLQVSIHCLSYMLSLLHSIMFKETLEHFLAPHISSETTADDMASLGHRGRVSSMIF